AHGRQARLLQTLAVVGISALALQPRVHLPAQGHRGLTCAPFAGAAVGRLALDLDPHLRFSLQACLLRREPRVALGLFFREPRLALRLFLGEAGQAVGLLLGAPFALFPRAPLALRRLAPLAFRRRFPLAPEPFLLGRLPAAVLLVDRGLLAPALLFGLHLNEDLRALTGVGIRAQALQLGE